VTFHCGSGSDTVQTFGANTVMDIFENSWLQAFGCTDIGMITATIG